MRISRYRQSVAAVVVIAACVAALAGTALAGTASAASTWPVYHGNNTRTGNDTTAPSLSPLLPAWTAALDGKVYAQPVVSAGRVIAATENNTVYALDAHDGTVLWSTHIGPPVTNVETQVGCGNIDPLGITSTPVIDESAHKVFVVAEIQDSFRVVHHQFVGLDLFTGANVVSVNADPGGSQNPLWNQQRAGLALGNGRVYIGFGGLAGDCGDYHGWLVSLDESGHNKVAFNATPHTGLGAIWATGGPSIDADGNVFVATGNPNAVTSTGDYGESVAKLDPTLHVLANFSGSNATDDEDLGSVGTALLPNNLAFQIGKQHEGYLLDSSNLSLLQALPNTCPGEAFGSTAFDGRRLFVPCTDHIQEIDIDTAHRTATLGWTGPSTGDAGPPILADGTLWSIDWDTGKLYALDPATGATRTTVSLGAVPHFASPTSALGLLLIGTDHGITALAGPAGPPTPAPPAPLPSTCSQQADHSGYWLVASDGGVFDFGGAPFCGSTGNLPLNQPIVGIAGTGGPGYRLVARDGGVFAFNTSFLGSMGGKRLNRPIVGSSASPSGNGYWLVASDGGVFAFGDATYLGSTGGLHLAAPIVGMAPTPSGNGYWLVASDGGVFAFGDAVYQGSMGGKHLNSPIVGLASSGAGYWMVAADGGIFAFGDATFKGSMGGTKLNRPVVGIAHD